MGVDDTDRALLRQCVDLAEEALLAGDEPYGSLLALGREVRCTDRNRTGEGDPTAHPEIGVVRWAIAHLTPEERADSTVYTSGEHCPMCAAAHAWAGLGRIVYATSHEQLALWRREDGASALPVAGLPIAQVAPGLVVDGPEPDLADRVRDLHRRAARAHSSGVMRSV